METHNVKNLSRNLQIVLTTRVSGRPQYRAAQYRLMEPDLAAIFLQTLKAWYCSKGLHLASKSFQRIRNLKLYSQATIDWYKTVYF
jgi:hypothetical protein